MKKGFTLVELLAVLVILAALILIIIPIVDDTIDKAEEKSNLRWAENYIRAVELAINVDELDVPIGTYDIMKNGNLCIGTYNKSSNKCTGYKLEVGITNTPKEGTITIANNLVFEYSITLENDKIVSNIDQNTTNPSCFEYVDNYDYTINEEVCIEKFMPIVAEKMNIEYSGIEDLYGAEVLCNPDATYEATNIIGIFIESLGLDLITFASQIDYSPIQLDSMGVISIEEGQENGNGTVSIKKYTCSEEIKDVIIPSKLGNKIVTSIGVFAISSTNLIELSETEFDPSGNEEKMINSVIIPNSVTSIGSNAFSYNKLTSVTIPDSVTSIDSSAFSENNLTNVTIPDSVTSIDSSAFSHNNLTNVTIPDSVTSIDSSAFSHNKLTSVTIPDSVTSIGGNAFSHNKLTSVTIPDSVTSIGGNAFSYNKLTSVTIPDSVTTIGGNAFSHNKLTRITIPDSVTTIGRYAFRYNKLNTIIIGSGITSIGDSAFGGGTYTDEDTGITYGPNALKNVYINRNSSDVSLETDIFGRNIVFGWDDVYSAESNLHWNSTGPTG